MYKSLRILLTYDGTTQGNSDRDAFKASIDSELSNSLVYPKIVLDGLLSVKSYCTLKNNTIRAEIIYDQSNTGVTNRTNFYNTTMTEKTKSTVISATIIKSDFLAESAKYKNAETQSKHP